jgi:hypothetical protein
MQNRRAEWELTDEKLTAYIPLTAKEMEIQNLDRRKPVSIVFPYSYAILETLMSYMIAAFLPEPIFRYEGTSPEDKLGAMLMERVINKHCNRTKVGLALHTWFRDSISYGFGVVAPSWEVITGQKVIKAQSGFLDGIGRFFGMKNFEKQFVDAVIFEGNSLQNIDPYKYLPDVAFPIHEPQRGEFVGWGDESNLMDILREEPSDIDRFNGRYLEMFTDKTSMVFQRDSYSSGRTARTSTTFDRRATRSFTHPVDRLHMYVKLIPEQWGLGSGQYPEKWLFTLCGDAIITTAKRLNFTHDMFPVAIIAPDFDGYSPIAYSRIEILSGMQTVIDWLFNSHITNVRKAINDMLIVDPYLININDLKDPEPGKLIRLRRPAWGKGTKDAVSQLAIQDITANNMGDVAYVIQYMQQIAGTDNPLMGNLRSSGPDRLSASEFSGTTQGGLQRMERFAKTIGLQGMQDVGYMFAHHTQQFMEESTYIDIIGEWQERLAKMYAHEGDLTRAKVTPYDVLVDYDLTIRDGSVPGGNFADVWQQMFGVIASQPELLQKFDIVKIFKHIATNLGAKNVDDFERTTNFVQPQVQEDEDVLRQVEQGNLVPLNGVNGAFNGTA